MADLKTSETAQVVEFPDADKERARRLRVEVERLARMSPSEWMYYCELDGYVEKYGITKAVFKQMVEAVIKENEKKAREDRGESQRTEKQKSTAKRESEREQKRKEREEERKTREAERKADRKEADKQRTFEMTIRLPSILHDGKLKELAKRIDEDVEILRVEFRAFAEEGRSEIVGDDPWPDPVDTKALLADVMAQQQRYMIVGDEQRLAMTLWAAFAWLHKDIAVHSPMLVFKSAEIDSGKTTACGVMKFLTPRAYSAGEMSGPSLYRFVDRVHPTLIIDNADKLLQRKPDLAQIINLSWTRGTPIPRVGPHGDTVGFDPFCPKVIAGTDLAITQGHSVARHRHQTAAEAAGREGRELHPRGRRTVLHAPAQARSVEHRQRGGAQGGEARDAARLQQSPRDELACAVGNR
jgi:hypothetical protein